MGPLTKMWVAMEGYMDSKRRKVDIDRDDLLQLAQQCVVLAGQNFNTISYHRRSNILNALFKEAKFKQTLKDKADLFLDSSKLFGEKFEEDLTKSLKSKVH